MRDATNLPPGWSPRLALPSGAVFSLMEATSKAGFFVSGVCAHKMVAIANPNKASALHFIISSTEDGSVIPDGQERFGRSEPRVSNRDPTAIRHAPQYPITPLFCSIEIRRFIQPINIGCSNQAGKRCSFRDGEIGRALAEIVIRGGSDTVLFAAEVGTVEIAFEYPILRQCLLDSTAEDNFFDLSAD